VLVIIGFISCTISLFAQQDAAVIGMVRDSKTKEPLPGVTVMVDGMGGTTTNESGKYDLTLQPGEHALTFRFVGYNLEQKKIMLKEKEARIINIDLLPLTTELGTVVVSAGKFEQKIEEVTVSMAVLTPTLIENTNATSLDEALEHVPGVTIVDGQANIRGGSGFSYGAGSRVLMLVDDLPMLAADANDVKWSFIPVENLEQVEVIKGASSALYGSAAMNGIINIRTAYPKATPETKVTLFGGMYDSPKNIAYKWWGNEKQMSQGISASHNRKIGNFDLVTGLNYFKDEGYRMGENEEHIRVNANTRYSFKNKLQGLSIGANTNYMHTEGGLFLLWQDDSTGALIPQGGLDSGTTISLYTTKRFNIDPFITYVSKNGETHKIRTRFFKTDNKNNTNQQSFAKAYYGEYQFQKRFSENFTWTWGFCDLYSDVESELYGDHLSNNVGLYTQADAKWNKWTFSFGARWEQNRIDTVKGEFTPVFRYGINYALFDDTHLRASYGQGYRFPSIAEKFVKTRVGDIVIYPNDSIQPETGFSAEIGINQGFKISGWKGSLDVAGFWSEYKDMMEFSFGLYGNPFVDP
ncbi:MAG: TonB-dependent receptor domain-containing protein, partial [Flavobacteriales bacterium]